MQCSCTLKDVWFGFFHSPGQLNSTQLRQWRLCISSMVQRLAEHLGMPPQSQKLTVSHTHSRCVSPSLATEAWARTGRSAPLTFCVSGRQNSHSVEGNRGGRVCSQLLWTWEPAERLLGALYLCKSLRLQSSNCHAQHSCSGLNSITGLFWAHGLATCSVSRSGSCWPSFTPLLDVRACEPFLLLFSAN